jgi:hypothetical protein
MECFSNQHELSFLYRRPQMLKIRGSQRYGLRGQCDGSVTNYSPWSIMGPFPCVSSSNFAGPFFLPACVETNWENCTIGPDLDSNVKKDLFFRLCKDIPLFLI